MQKLRDSEIKSFSFSDLKGTPVDGLSELKSFNFKALEGISLKENNPTEADLRVERGFEQKNNFKIDDIVRECRGLSRQEQNDLEQKIQQEVKIRLDVAYQGAIKEGREQGREEGKQEALAQFQTTLGQRLDDFAELVQQVQHGTDKVLELERKSIYEFIKRFTKWIVLKEINEKVYLEGLLEKLILELNARKNLTVKVGRANFAQMPEIIAVVEAKLGKLSNVRVEVVPEIAHPGIILESENGLIDGSIEGVFANIDKIFEQFGNHNE